MKKRAAPAKLVMGSSPSRKVWQSGLQSIPQSCVPPAPIRLHHRALPLTSNWYTRPRRRSGTLNRPMTMTIRTFLLLWKHPAPDIAVANEPKRSSKRMRMTTKRQAMALLMKRKTVCPQPELWAPRHGTS